MKYLPIELLPTLADRLKYAMEQLNLSQTDVAKLSGCSQATIFKIVDGQTRESRKTGAIARGLNLSLSWLENGDMPATVTPIVRHQEKPVGPLVLDPVSAWDSNTPLNDDEVEIPLFKQVEISAGAGRTAVQAEYGRVLRFSLATLRQCGVDPANALCAPVTGRSQEPLILHGATVGIDRGMTRVIADHLYAIEQDGALRIKFLERLDGGGLRLISYNQSEHPDETYTFEQFVEQQMKVLGRVFWWSTVRPVNAPPLPRNHNT
ncbi:XRE family transcriptional regulator [Pseudomonas koreensis]|uniref:XRE family transcriptional regulator n=1 Tax=Pseudomonas koreensis TaxID=198620 RepID=UPI002FC91C46